MIRRLLTVIMLVVVALALWGVLSFLNLRPVNRQGVARFNFQPPNPTGLQEPLSRLPDWVSSPRLKITLIFAGLANFHLLPTRVRNMRHALTLGWARFDRVLLLVFVIGAVLARVILPFIIIPAIGAFFLSLVYTGGRSLLIRSVWRGSSPTLSLALELLLLLPLVRIPYVGGFFVILYLSLGLGLVISTHFGSNGPWNLTPLLEEDRT